MNEKTRRQISTIMALIRKNISHSLSTCCSFIIQTRLQPMNMSNSAISCQQHGLKGDCLPFLNFIIVLEIFSILWPTKNEKVTKVELFQKLSFYSKKADNHQICHIKRRLLTRCTEQNSTYSFDFWKKCFFDRFLAVPACNNNVPTSDSSKAVNNSTNNMTPHSPPHPRKKGIILCV